MPGCCQSGLSLGGGSGGRHVEDGVLYRAAVQRLAEGHLVNQGAPRAMLTSTASLRMCESEPGRPPSPGYRRSRGHAQHDDVRPRQPCPGSTPDPPASPGMSHRRRGA